MTHVKRVVLIRLVALTFLCAAIALGGMARSAHASSSITYTGQIMQFGTGFGTVLNLATYQQNGSEWGEISRGDGVDLYNGSANQDPNQPGGLSTESGKTATISAQQLLTLGTVVNPLGDTTFGLLFDIAQTGSQPTITLNGYTLTFWSSTGGPIGVDDLTFDPTPLTLSGDGLGVGVSGYLFLVTLSQADAQAFFETNSGSNRIGMRIEQTSAITSAISDSNDGPDTFFVAQLNTLTPVPEPSTVALALSGLGTLGFAGLRRYRRRSADA